MYVLTYVFIFCGCYFYAIIILASLTVFCNCYDVIIIGAGASGIAAGMYLLNNGVDNFVILEAEDRIGGRINSTKFGESLVDLGAEWCLGEENNKVYSIAADYHLLKPVNEYYQFISSDSIRYVKSTQEGMLECRKSFSNNFLDITALEDNATLRDAFFKYYNDKVISRFIALDPAAREYGLQTLQVLSSLALTHESFYSWDDIPVRHNYRKCFGHLQHFNGLGFHVLLKVMMKEFLSSAGESRIHSKIIHNSEVRKIIWRKENITEVIVISTSGNYIAKHVIFTPSLGVLKNMHSTLFEPSLPQHKINAINCLGFEGTMKVFLQFSEPWWIGKFEPTLLVWRNTERTEIERMSSRNRTRFEELYMRPSLENRDPWMLALNQLLPSPNNPTVIEAWFTGEMSKGIETIPDELLINGIMHVLSTFCTRFRNNTKPPDNIFRSYWNTNPHFLGSHSYETNRRSPFSASCNVDLATPLYRNNTPVVLFAGEATSKHHYSTVHGAIESGEREGYRLISRTSLKTGAKVTCLKYN